MAPVPHPNTPALQRTPITAEDRILGPKQALATLLEYGDFECPHCAAARPVLESLVVENLDTLRLVYRHFPITSIHPHAQMAAEAAEASGAQGKFWEMHDLIFTHQDRLEAADLRRYATAIDLNLVRFDREMAVHTHLPAVRDDFRRGLEDGVNGTPTFFVNRLRYDGPRDRGSILAEIVAQVAAARV
ncbi:MAG TPA: DsbA family protein [Candidatus Dormibacteraeota bacterium]|nr:DsbA family protein [Candidatus Dormibacteraeota bacterium]